MKTSTKHMNLRLRAVPFAAKVGLMGLAGLAVLAGCGGSDSEEVAQPVMGARSKPLLTLEGKQFKDSNGNGKLDAYEDWRLSTDERVDNLLNSSDAKVRMTLAEKIGLLHANTMVAIGGSYPSAEIGGNPSCPTGETGKKYVCEADTAASWGTTRMLNEFNGRYFIIRSNPPVGTLTTWLNNVQQIAEESRLGIPVVFVSNPRNHAAAGIGLSEASGVFSYWPGTLGLAAANDPALVKEFAEIAAKEWRATGIRKGYSYQVDLASEPRWSRNNGTFGDDPTLVSAISRNLVLGFQGTSLGADSISLTMKHWPGNGIAPRGIDSHGAEGAPAVYATAGSLLNWQMKPFQAAVDAGVASIMTYYQYPKNAGSAEQLPRAYWFSPTQQFEEVAMAYNSKMVEYLRKEMGFKGYLNTDSGVVFDAGTPNAKPWGVETLTMAQRLAKSFKAGVSLQSVTSTNFTGANGTTPILGTNETMKAMQQGLLTEADLNAAAAPLLKEMFMLGVFENPYVNTQRALATVRSTSFQAKAEVAHRKSVVLLKNSANTLPIAKTVGSNVRIYGEVFTKSNAATLTQSLRTKLAETFPGAQFVTDYTQATHAIVLVQPTLFEASDAQGKFNKIALDTDTGVNVARIKAIQAVAKTAVAVNFGSPWLISEIEPGAAAMIATYDTTSEALFDVITGVFKPTGKLPMALPKSQEAINANASDTPGHLEKIDYPYKDVNGNIYTFGFGLNYP